MQTRGSGPVGVLRPVPTLEQVVRLPNPLVEHPLRIPETSRPDPNIWEEHENAVTSKEAKTINHITHIHETKMAAMEAGVPMDVLRSIQHSAESMANSAQIHSMAAGSMADSAGMMSSGAPDVPMGVPSFDLSERQGLIQELMKHHREIAAHQERAFTAKQDEMVAKLAGEIEAARAKKDFVDKHAAAMKPIQDSHQKLLEQMRAMMGDVGAFHRASQASSRAQAEEHERRLARGEMAQDKFFALMEQHQNTLGEILAGGSQATREDIERAMLALGQEAQSHRDSLGLAIMRQGQTFFEMLSRMRPPRTSPEPAPVIDDHIRHDITPDASPERADSVGGETIPYGPGGRPIPPPRARTEPSVEDVDDDARTIPYSVGGRRGRPRSSTPSAPHPVPGDTEPGPGPRSVSSSLPSLSRSPSADIKGGGPPPPPPAPGGGGVRIQDPPSRPLPLRDRFDPYAGVGGLRNVANNPKAAAGLALQLLGGGVSPAPPPPELPLTPITEPDPFRRNPQQRKGVKEASKKKPDRAAAGRAASRAARGEKQDAARATTPGGGAKAKKEKEVTFEERSKSAESSRSRTSRRGPVLPLRE